MTRTTINITAVKNNALTITSQAEGWDAAVNEVCRWLDDPFYSREGIRAIYLSDGLSLEVHDVDSIRYMKRTLFKGC